jgi:hypothetical protein
MMDKKMMMKMMGKKDDEEMGMKKNAKMEVLKELRKMASDMMAEDLKGGMKKVTVAAKDEEGLKEGLEKAEDMLEERMGDFDMPDMEEEDDMEMSDEDEMMKKLKMKMMKKD